jgi:collagen triple helix repeat protein
MPHESSSLLPPSERAASALEQALARVVAHVRAEFVAEKRAMEAELKLARAELASAFDRMEGQRKEFADWLAGVQNAKIELRGEPGAAGAAGKDGAPGAAGEPGREGPPGRDGRDGMQGPIGEPGKHGRDGVDGKDGLGFDDARQFLDRENFGIEFLRGAEVIRKFTWQLPTLADYHCGPYRTGEKYRRGQCATYGGSTFLCLRDTEQKPETDDWRLIVKHGLPGRAGKDGERGAPGPAGRDGRDLTQMTSGGLKYG